MAGRNVRNEYERSSNSRFPNGYDRRPNSRPPARDSGPPPAAAYDQRYPPAYEYNRYAPPRAPSNFNRNAYRDPDRPAGQKRRADEDRPRDATDSEQSKRRKTNGGRVDQAQQPRVSNGGHRNDQSASRGLSGDPMQEDLRSFNWPSAGQRPQQSLGGDADVSMQSNTRQSGQPQAKSQMTRQTSTTALPPSTQAAGQKPGAFVCSYHEANKASGRAIQKPGELLPFRSQEFRIRPGENFDTDEAKKVETLVDTLKTVQLTPETFNATLLWRLEGQERATALRNMNIFGNVAFGRDFSDKFKAKHWCKDLATKNRLIRPGVIFSTPVFELLRNSKLPIDSPDRINSSQGPAIVKTRRNVTLRMRGNERECVSFTSFGDGEEGEPPTSFREEYVQFAHVDDEVDEELDNDPDDENEPESKFKIPVVRVGGRRDVFTKPSYTQWSRPFWMSLVDVPVTKGGRVAVKDFEKAADIMGLDAEHEFRVEGQRLLLLEREVQRNEDVSGFRGAADGAGGRMGPPPRPGANSRAGNEGGRGRSTGRGPSTGRESITKTGVNKNLEDSILPYD